MKDINSFKQTWLAILIFLLPLASYLHLFFIDYPSDSFLQVLSFKIFGVGVDVTIHFLFAWVSYSLLYFIWWKLIIATYKWFVLLFIGLVLTQSDLLLLRIEYLTLKFEFFILLFAFFTIYLRHYTFFFKRFKSDVLKKPKKSSLVFPVLFFISVFLSFVYLIYPDDTDSLIILFLELDANYFQDAAFNLYMITYKFSILFSFLIWFFTEKRWYRYALLSSIIILTNQLFNMLWIKGDILDEFELSQSGFFLFSVLLGLILISHAAHNQARIRSFMFDCYKNVEESVTNRFKAKQNFIDIKRKEFNNSKTSLEELKKIRGQLEKTIGRNTTR